MKLLVERRFLHLNSSPGKSCKSCWCPTALLFALLPLVGSKAADSFAQAEKASMVIAEALLHWST